MASRFPKPDTAVRRSSGEEAAAYIRRLIFDGELAPGERVPQDEVAQALGISRIPLREALIALEREGWVTLEMNRGAFVNPFDDDSVRDHYELFGLLYGFAVRRALTRSGGELVERLSAIVDDLNATTDNAERGRLLFTFFATVVEGARSPRLRVVLRAMSTPVQGDFFATLPVAVDIEQRAAAAIVRALKRDDADRAAFEYERMMSRLGAEVVALLKERGLIG